MINDGVRDSAVEVPAGLLDDAAKAGEDVTAALTIAREYGGTLPLPADSHTSRRWAILAEVAAVNLTVARVLEAHADALAILAEADLPYDAAQAWGVFAAEDPRYVLRAAVTPDGAATLDGTKPWCSLGGDLDAALVTAHVGDARQLFRVDLRQPGVRAHAAEGWVARGLRTVVSVPVDFDAADAGPVGAPGWYLTRPGFAWGGIGVAACWHGGAHGVAGAVLRAARRRGDQLATMHLGAVDAALTASRATLMAAARAVDAHPPPDRPDVLALRTRAVVAGAVEQVLTHAAHALGPAPLAFDADHAARVADLEVYVRQHHAERDLAALGAAIAERET